MAKSFKALPSVSGERVSPIRRYQDLVIGSRKLRSLIGYELVQIFSSWVPGALGLLLRKKLYPLLLGSCGKGCIFGRNVVLRHPSRIHLSDGVVVDDNVLLDAKGDDSEGGIFLEKEAFVGRGTILSCKGGRIHLGERANLGFYVEIFTSNQVSLGADVMVAAYCYLVGGGNYCMNRRDLPMNQQYDYEGKGGIVVEDDVWLGAHVVVMDGITLGRGSVLGAGAVVTKSTGAYEIWGGVPAKFLRERPAESADASN
ncbi:MAG: acyltransferase [Puniceicoccaceae bacterium]